MSIGICAVPLHLSSCGRTDHILDGWFSCVTSLCWEHPPIHHALTQTGSLHTACRYTHCCLEVHGKYLHSHTPSISIRCLALESPALKKYPDNLHKTYKTLLFHQKSRKCDIKVVNCLFALLCRVYMESGFCQHPPQPTIQSTKTEVCSFTKDDNTATGAVGLLTYDLFHMATRVCVERMAILFSVPYDHNLYKNRLAVGVVLQSSECDKHLYKMMYDGKDLSHFSRADANGCGLEYRAEHVDVRATMSSVGKGILKVELYDKMGR